ncbi:hypothetical protein QUA27_18730 [Microcoleus sp. Pol14C6]
MQHNLLLTQEAVLKFVFESVVYAGIELGPSFTIFRGAIDLRNNII